MLRKVFEYITKRASWSLIKVITSKMVKVPLLPYIYQS